jgi:phosphatidylglycerophosphate synthase
VFNYFGKDELEKQIIFASKRDQFLRPLVKQLTKWGIKPNHITLFSVLLLFVAVSVVMSNPILGGLLGLFYNLLDGVDGPLARYQKVESNGGSLIDILADQIGIVILPIFAVLYFDTNFIFAYIFGLFYIIEIFLLTILNSLNIEIGFVLRVKYFYYVLFLISAFLHADYVGWFHIIFGMYYLFHSLFLYYVLVKHFSIQNSL